WFARRLGPGGAFGIGSLVYGLAALGRLTGRGDLLDHARRAAALITPPRIAEDTVFDVTGGCAGALLGLLALQQLESSDDVAAAAVACGEQLLRHQSVYTGAGMEPGFAHGSAGIALALSRLGARTG